MEDMIVIGLNFFKQFIVRSETQIQKSIAKHRILKLYQYPKSVLISKSILSRS